MKHPVRTGVELEWCVPSIDQQLANEYAHEIGHHYRDLILDAIQTTLDTLYHNGTKTGQRQAYIWAKLYGINDDGTMGEPWKKKRIAEHMGISREYVDHLYWGADLQIQRAINLAQHNLIKALLSSTQ